MTDDEVQAAVSRVAELRDAAINAATAAWRVTGLEAHALIHAANDYERPLSLEEVACLSGDSLGWAALAERAQRMADAWTRAAEDWQAAEADLQRATVAAIAELRRQHAAAEQLQPQHAAPEKVTERNQERLAAVPVTQAFQIKTGPSSRTVRRTTPPNGGVPVGSHRAAGARVTR